MFKKFKKKKIEKFPSQNASSSKGPPEATLRESLKKFCEKIYFNLYNYIFGPKSCIFMVHITNANFIFEQYCVKASI